MLSWELKIHRNEARKRDRQKKRMRRKKRKGKEDEDDLDGVSPAQTLGKDIR